MKYYHVTPHPHPPTASHMNAAGAPVMLRAYATLPDGFATAHACETVEEAEAHFGLARVVRPPAPPPPVVVPKEINQRQLRLELLSRGITEASVVGLLNANPDATARAAALIEWEYAAAISRTHPLVAGMAAALGLSSADVDALFIAAKAR
jgi:hypothetical protein